LDLIEQAETADQSVQPRRLVTYGWLSREWRSALEPGAPVWRRFPWLEVRHASSRLGLLRQTWGAQSYVLPLWPRQARKCPPWWWVLRSDRQVLDALDNKLGFARLLRRLGLEHLGPRTFIDDDPPEFPLAMKPTRGANGQGVRFITSPVELAAALAEPSWRKRAPLLQERIPGGEDFVTYVVCRGGRILGHRSLRYQLGQQAIQTSESIVRRESWTAEAQDLQLFEQILVPLDYDGPATIDWRRRPDGRLVIFEINPRLGGSLMRPEYEDNLAEMLRLILENARPPRLSG
jgi:predicted ATP-grasp superfamily ATP-dependent carboligase